MPTPLSSFISGRFAVRDMRQTVAVGIVKEFTAEPLNTKMTKAAAKKGKK